VPLKPRNSGSTGGRNALIAAIAALVLVASVLLARRRRRKAPDVQAVHRRRGIELVELARSLGVRVAQADTAAAICRAIHAKTGRDLTRELTTYEAARFGAGPPPPPWPALRTAGRG